MDQCGHVCPLIKPIRLIPGAGGTANLNSPNCLAGKERKKILAVCVLRERGCFGVIVQSLSHVRLFLTPWTAACQAFLSFTISWSLLKLMSIELVMPSNHLFLCRNLFIFPVFPNPAALKVLVSCLSNVSAGLSDSPLPACLPQLTCCGRRCCSGPFFPKVMFMWCLYWRGVA